MSALEKFLLRASDSLGFRLRRRQIRRALRGTPGGWFGTFDTFELLRSLQDQPPRVIYDLGANRGQWTLLARSVFAGAELHAFEPLPAHCAEFTARTSALRDVHLHPVAVGDANGEMEMDVTTFSDSASLLAPTTAMTHTYAVQSGAKVRTRVVRLDDWVAAQNLPAPDLLKLDLQGYELHALRGAPHCLRHANVVILELSFREFYHGQPTPGAVIGFLESAGFHLAAFSPDISAGRPLDQLDALFRRAG